jgi:hypothetical protein
VRLLASTLAHALAVEQHAPRDEQALLRRAAAAHALELATVEGNLRGSEALVRELTLRVVELHEEVAEKQTQNEHVQQMLLNSGISPEVFAGNGYTT